MAAVLSSGETGYFGLRRSHSAPKFGAKQTTFRTSSSTSRISEIYDQQIAVFSDSLPSSAPPSPLPLAADPADPALDPLRFGAAQPADDDDDDDDDDHFDFPQYAGAVGLYTQESEDLEPPPSPRGLGDSYTVSPCDNTTSTGTSRPSTPDLPDERAGDDTAVRPQPSRHVDYLSHDWKEEDIWESWKYIISRKGEYTNAARLENASWRTWMKSKNKLNTLSAEKLNWLKDCDVTWLYGPLQTGKNILSESRPMDSVELTKSNSFLLNKKPILKKRSMSEMMLQRSLSTSSLIKQAAAAVEAQQKENGGRIMRPGLERAVTDSVAFGFSPRRPSAAGSSMAQSATSSGLVSPGVERKHIHFNEKVEQCIAVEAKGDDDTDVDVDRYRNSDSDDDAITMKRSKKHKKLGPSLLGRKLSNGGGGGGATTESKTIAMLPSTKLKNREDTPEPLGPGSAMRHSYRSPVISPSSSQETLRPSRASGKLFIADDEDEDEDEDEEDEDQNDDDDDDDNDDNEEGDGTAGADSNGLVRFRATSTPKQAIGSADGTAQERPSGLKRSASSSSLAGEQPAGMRRTESGMFMPYEEGEPAVANGGIVGRVIETVNTARDIAHVIWNVGWRK